MRIEGMGPEDVARGERVAEVLTGVLRKPLQLPSHIKDIYDKFSDWAGKNIPGSKRVESALGWFGPQATTAGEAVAAAGTGGAETLTQKMSEQDAGALAGASRQTLEQMEVMRALAESGGKDVRGALGELLAPLMKEGRDLNPWEINVAPKTVAQARRQARARQSAQRRMLRAYQRHPGLAAATQALQMQRPELFGIQPGTMQAAAALGGPAAVQKLIEARGGATQKALESAGALPKMYEQIGAAMSNVGKAPYGAAGQAAAARNTATGQAATGLANAAASGIMANLAGLGMVGGPLANAFASQIQGLLGKGKILGETALAGRKDSMNYRLGWLGMIPRLLSTYFMPPWMTQLIAQMGKSEGGQVGPGFGLGWEAAAGGGMPPGIGMMGGGE